MRQAPTSSISSPSCWTKGLLGGFHFNARKYADDDLIVGTINPFELFLIYNELVGAAATPIRSGRAAPRMWPT